MAENLNEDSLGQLDVDIRANLDNFDKDLESLRKSMGEFDSAAASGAKSLNTFEQVSALSARTNADVERSLSGVESSVARTANLYSDLENELMASNAAMASFINQQRDVITHMQLTTTSTQEVAEAQKKSSISFIGAAITVAKYYGTVSLLTRVLRGTFPAFDSFLSKLTASTKITETASAAWEVASKKAIEMAPAFMKTEAAVKSFAKVADTAGIAWKAYSKLEGPVELIGMASAFPKLSAAAVVLLPALRSIVALDFKEAFGGLKAAFTLISSMSPAFALFAGTVSQAIGFLSKFAVPILAATAALTVFKMVLAQAEERIAKVTALQKLAEETGFGEEYIQRAQKAAEETKLSFESILETMKKFKKASTADDFKIVNTDSEEELLSPIEQRLNKLTEIGKFANNQYIKVYREALTVEDKFKAIINLMEEAVRQREGLAAKNIGSLFLSEAQFQRFRDSSKYISELKQQIDSVSATDIISAESIARAKDIRDRIKDATDYLGVKWIPFQEEIISLGLDLKSVYASILELIVSTFKGIENIAGKISGIIPVLKAAGAAGAALVPGMQAIAGVLRLIAGLKGEGSKLTQGDAAALNQATLTLESINKAVYDGNALLDRNTKAWEKEIEQIEKHTLVTRANAIALHKGAAEQESVRAELKLLNVAQKANLGVTEEQIEAYIEHRGEMSAEAALIAARIKLEGDLKDAFLETTGAAKTASILLKNKTIAEIEAQETAKHTISIDAIYARSPREKALIAQRNAQLAVQQAIKDTQGSAEALRQSHEAGARAYELVLNTELKGIAEARRQRELSAELAIDSAKVSIQTIGKSVGETHRLQTVEQTRQQLITEAAARGETYDKAELDRLTDKITKTAELKQKEAELNAQATANFNLQTLFLSDTEKQVASVLYSLHKDNWEQFKNSGVASTTRLTSALTTLRDTAKSFADTLVDGFMRGEKFMDSLTTGFKNLANQLVKMATNALINMLFSNLFGSGAAAGGLLSNVLRSDQGNVFQNGNVTRFDSGGVVSVPSIFRMANGGLASIAENEPEAILPLRRLPGGRLGVESMSNNSRNGNTMFAPSINVAVTMPNGGNREDGARFGKEIAKIVESKVMSLLVAQRRSGGMLS